MNGKNLGYKTNPKIINRRIFSSLFDWIVLACFLVTTILLIDPLNKAAFSIILLCFFIVCVLYFTLLEHFCGCTIGKRLFSLRVINRDCQNPKIYQSFIRALFWLIEINPAGLFFWPITYEVVKKSLFKRRIGDMVANTYVVYKADLLDFIDSPTENSMEFNAFVLYYNSNNGLTLNGNVNHRKLTYESTYGINTNTFGDAKSFIYFAIIFFVGLGLALALIGNNYAPSDKQLKLDYEKGNYQKIIDYSETDINGDPSYILLLYKGHSLYELGEYQKAIDVYKKLEKMNAVDANVYENMSYCNFHLDQNNEALRCIDRAISFSPKSSSIYTGKGYILNSLYEYDQSIETMDQLLVFDSNNYEAYYIKGLAYLYKEDYDIADAMFDKGISLYPDDVDLYICKAQIRYWQYDYSDCIEYCDKALESFPNDEDLIWYKADSYYSKQDYSNALIGYKDLLILDPDNDYASALLAWQYYYLQDYENALVYTDRSLAINADNYDASELKKLLLEAEKPESEQIANFVRENYLYKDKVPDFDAIVDEFSKKGDVDTDEIGVFLNSIIYKDDYFTFLINEQEYDLLLLEEGNNHIRHDILNYNNKNKALYVKIESFTSGIASEFREIVNSISDPESYDLVIDLRDNPGGLTHPTNMILDILLPECVTSYIIYRDGTIYTNYSDKLQTTFNHIYVFVNGNSASSSELLSLGLKKHLNNVTIIGTPTVGKGVGQRVFEEKKEKYMIFLVNHYWNVKETNIQGMSITPDILVNSDSIDAYFSSIGNY